MTRRPNDQMTKFNVCQPQSARSSRSAFAITMIDAPVSARTAIQSVATPVTAATTNAAFMTMEIARLVRMLRSVARLRRSV